MMAFDLNGKVAIVTGAARGIGFATAARLAGLGASVLMADVDPAELSTAQARIGARVRSAACDLTRDGAAEQVVAAALEHFGGIDILVNNAGYTWDSVIQKTTDEQFRAMLEIHLVAPFRVLRAASEWIRPAARGEAGTPKMRKVVNVSSISGLDGNAGQIGYSSGKAGVVGMTRTMAKEWGRYNVNVNAVAFGLIDTRLTQSLESGAIAVGAHNVRVGMRPEARTEAAKQIPLGRVGTTEDAANAILFFCSPLSDYVTGEVLVCSGGLHF